MELQVVLTNGTQINIKEWTKFEYRKKYFIVFDHKYTAFRTKKKNVLYILQQ